MATTISAEVTEEFSRRLHKAAAERGWSKSRAIREAVELWLLNPLSVLRSLVEAIEDEHRPAFREPLLSDDDLSLLHMAHDVLRYSSDD